jgi:hypothetical protein
VCTQQAQVPVQGVLWPGAGGRQVRTDRDRFGRGGAGVFARVAPKGCLVWWEHELASYLLLSPSLSFCLPLTLRLSVLLQEEDEKAQARQLVRRLPDVAPDPMTADSSVDSGFDPASDDEMTTEQAEEMVRKDLSSSSRQSKGGAEVSGSGGINSGAEEGGSDVGGDATGDTESEADDGGYGERPAGSGAVCGGGGGGCAGPATRGGEGAAKEGEENGKSSEEGGGREGQESSAQREAADARLTHLLLLAAHCSPEKATSEADSAVAKPQPIKAVNLGEGWFEYTGCACGFGFVCVRACFLCSVSLERGRGRGREGVFCAPSRARHVTCSDDSFSVSLPPSLPPSLSHAHPLMYRYSSRGADSRSQILPQQKHEANDVGPPKSFAEARGRRNAGR